MFYCVKQVSLENETLCLHETNLYKLRINKMKSSSNLENESVQFQEKLQLWKGDDSGEISVCAHRFVM